MSRAPRAVPSHARRQRVFKAAKGFRGRRKNTITSANAAVDHSLQYNYIGRKLKKRNFRALWIQRINAACR
ncbi:MAG TPA: 50S ribosomal protein L20, partial [Rhizomicrobium sp.]